MNQFFEKLSRLFARFSTKLVAALHREELAKMEQTNPLLCVITGMEHSGTTLLSQMLNGHPRVASGVECGILLSEIRDYYKIQPFYDWLIHENWGWAMRPEDRSQILKARSYAEAYHMFNRFKGRAHSNPDLRKLFAESDLIYDKTPAYVYDLSGLIKSVRKPFVVLYKTPAEGLLGAKKRSHDAENFLLKYRVALSEIVKAKRSRPNQVLIVRYESLATDFDLTMKAVMEFIDLKNDTLLSLSAYNERFGRLIDSRNSFEKQKITYQEPTGVFDEEEEVALRRFTESVKDEITFVMSNSI